FDRSHLAQGHGVDLGVGWWRHLTFSLPYGVGAAMLIASAFGAGWVIVRAPARAQIVLAFPLLYYAVIGSGQTVFVRYVTLLTPFVCLFAAVAVVWIARRARSVPISNAGIVISAAV